MADRVVASSNFLVPNATFFAVLVLFLILLAIIRKFIVPPVQKALSERAEIIAGQVSDSAETQAKLAESEAEYRGALTEARSQAAQIRENARAEAQRTTDELRAQAQEESARIIARGEEQLSTQREAIVRELRGEIGTLALELSQKIVSQPVADDQRTQARVEAFLTDLDRRESAGSVAGTASPGSAGSTA
jgi:F-type H+-transporting ATPase subunit b